MGRLKIGVIVNIHGLQGDCKVKSFTDFPDERFKVHHKIIALINKSEIELEINRKKEHKDCFLIQFKGYEDINLAEKLKGSELFIDSSQIHALKKGEYYFFELVGLNVYDEQNNFIGIVSKIEEMSVQRIVRISREKDKDVLVPYVDQFIKKIDLDTQTMVIHVLEGLL